MEVEAQVPSSLPVPPPSQSNPVVSISHKDQAQKNASLFSTMKFIEVLKSILEMANKGFNYVEKGVNKCWKGFVWMIKKCRKGSLWMIKKCWKGAVWLTKKGWKGIKGIAHVLIEFLKKIVFRKLVAIRFFSYLFSLGLWGVGIFLILTDYFYHCKYHTEMFLSREDACKPVSRGLFLSGLGLPVVVTLISFLIFLVKIIKTEQTGITVRGPALLRDNLIMKFLILVYSLYTALSVILATPLWVKATGQISILMVPAALFSEIALSLSALSGFMATTAVTSVNFSATIAFDPKQQDHINAYIPMAVAIILFLFSIFVHYFIEKITHVETPQEENA